MFDKLPIKWYASFMARMTLDRMTIDWKGEGELETAERLRRAIPRRELTSTIKAILSSWLNDKGRKVA